MKIEQLEKLADAASKDTEWWKEVTLVKMMEPYTTNYTSTHYSDAKYIAATSPQTVKQLIALLKMAKQALAMLQLKSDPKYGAPIAMEAIRQIEEYENESKT